MLLGMSAFEESVRRKVLLELGVQPIGPVHPIQPLQLVQPVAHVQPFPHEQPVQSVSHVQPFPHEQPVQPVVSVQPIQYEQPVQTVAHVQPIQPVQPVSPVQPLSLVQPISPVQPVVPVEPTVPAVASQAIHSVLPPHFVQSVESVQPVETMGYTEILESLQPEQPEYLFGNRQRIGYPEKVLPAEQSGESIRSYKSHQTRQLAPLDFPGYQMGNHQVKGYSELPESLESLEEGKEAKPLEPLVGMVFFGFVANLPMNYLFQEIAYYKSIFGESFGTQCAMVYSICNLIGQILVLWKGASFSFGSRLTFSGISIAFVLFFVPLMTIYRLPFQLGISVSLIGVMGFMVAIFMSAAMGLTGLLSKNLRNFFSVGMALPGLSAWPLMLLFDLFFANLAGLSKLRKDATTPSPVDTATTLTLMSVAGFAVLACVVYYWFGLSKSASVRDALAAHKHSQSVAAQDDDASLKGIAPALPMALAVFGVFFVCFIVLPDQVSAWRSERKYIGGEFGYQNLNYYVFQTFDFVGRLIAAMGVSVSPLWVGIGSIARFGFLPFFFLSSHKVFVFGNDLFRFVLNALFATTYGFLLTLGLQYGPAAVSKNQAEKAGYIMSFALTIGIFFGSCFALGIQLIPARILQGVTYMRECSINPDTAEMVCLSNLGTTRMPRPIYK